MAVSSTKAKSRGQGLNDSHFDSFLNLFRAALREVGVKDDKADKVMKLLESRRAAVLNR